MYIRPEHENFRQASHDRKLAADFLALRELCPLDDNDGS